MKHHERLMSTYTSVLAPRTWRIKLTHIRLYLQFCLDHDMTIHSPTVYDLLSYILFLLDRLKSPDAIVSYFSVKLWIASGPGSALAFGTYKVKTMKRDIFKNTRHVVSHIPPFVPADFKRIFSFLYTLSQIPVGLIAALVLGYFMPQRQSNLVCSSTIAVACLNSQMLS